MSMLERRPKAAETLFGIGLYTPAEAGRLLRVPPKKIVRWMRGHQIGEREYPPLWMSEIDLKEDRLFLGFRDLMEVRVADAFIKAGVSSVRVRSAIRLAEEVLGRNHPLSTNRFRTDGREIFLHVIETDEKGQEKERLLNLFRRQYEFKGIIDPLLKTVDFDKEGSPTAWWPHGRQAHIVLDPNRAFGQPIDSVSSVPTAILAATGNSAGSKITAQAYDVPESSVVRAMDFEASLVARHAA
ncbi:hypothetical protein ABMA32_02370 [Mesorhizobium sp. VNQ89]|uniref:hypothetical protein n=1 Tax=Mesorhizobium quangtriensis TaxID=3157709 RepID=UPI0032B72064